MHITYYINHNQIQMKVIKLVYRCAHRKRMYEIIQQQEDKFNLHSQQFVLSKYLKSNKIQILHQNRQQKDQSLTKISYNKFMQQNPYGSVKTVSYKNTQLTLFSTNYQKVRPLNLLEGIFKSDGDAIIVQSQPSLQKYYIQACRNKEDVFSDIKYLQLLKKSCQLDDTFYDNLMKNRRVQKNPPIPYQIQQSFKYDILPGFARGCAQHWSQKNNKQLYYCEIPEQSYRQWIVNTHTLMQLQQIFKSSVSYLPRYSQLSLTPFKMATLLYPEIFLSYKDLYTATIIQMLIATKKYKKISAVLGLMENQSVVQCLSKSHQQSKNNPLQPIINLLVPEKPKGSIIRNIQFWQIAEKHIILDLMYYGRDITKIPLQNLTTTNKIIQFYMRQDPQYSQKPLDVRHKISVKFRFDIILKYIQMYETRIKQAKDEIKKQFVREAIRSRKIN